MLANRNREGTLPTAMRTHSKWGNKSGGIINWGEMAHQGNEQHFLYEETESTVRSGDVNSWEISI